MCEEGWKGASDLSRWISDVYQEKRASKKQKQTRPDANVKHYNTALEFALEIDNYRDQFQLRSRAIQR
jgi:hypothetical protein